MDFSFFSSPTVVVVFVVCAIAAVMGIAGSVLRAIAERDELASQAPKMNSQPHQPAPQGQTTPPMHPGARQDGAAMNVPPNRRRPRLALAAEIAKGAAAGSSADPAHQISAQTHQGKAGVQPGTPAASPSAGSPQPVPLQEKSGMSDLPTVLTATSKPHAQSQPAPVLKQSKNSDLIVPHAPTPKLAKILGPDLPQPVSSAEESTQEQQPAVSCDDATRSLPVKQRRLHGHARRPHDLDQVLPDPAPEQATLGSVGAADAATTRVLHLGPEQPTVQSGDLTDTTEIPGAQTPESVATKDTHEAATVQIPVPEINSGSLRAQQAMKDAQTRAILLDQPNSSAAQNDIQSQESSSAARNFNGSVATTTGQIPITAVPTSLTADLPELIPPGSSDLASRLSAADGGAARAAGVTVQKATAKKATADSLPAQKIDTASLPLSTRIIPLNNASVPSQQIQPNDDAVKVAGDAQDAATLPPAVAGLEMLGTDEAPSQRSYAGVPSLEYRPGCPLSMPRPGDERIVDVRDLPSDETPAHASHDEDQSCFDDEQLGWSTRPGETADTDEPKRVTSRSQLRQRRIAYLEAGVPDDAAWSRAPLQRDFEFAPVED